MKLSLVAGVTFAMMVPVLPPRMARAQETPPPVTTQETISATSGPSMPMVGSGLVLFGLSYVPAVAVAATSQLNADKTLLVPLAGPWIDLSQRPSCSGTGGACNSENTAKVAIIVDGVFQALGGLTVIGGFMTTSRETTTVQRSSQLSPTLRLSPASMGAGGYGVNAAGTF